MANLKNGEMRVRLHGRTPVIRDRICLRLEQLEARLMLSAPAPAPGLLDVGQSGDPLGDSPPYYLGRIPGGGSAFVDVYAADDSADVTLDSIAVTPGKGDSIASITLRGSHSLSGLGLVISGATSVGSIKDTRTDAGVVAFIVSDAPIASLSLNSGASGYNLNGLTLNGLTLPEDIDGDQNTDDVTALYCTRSLGKVAVSGDLEGEIVLGADNGLSLKSLSVKNGGLAGDLLAQGSIGTIDVTGGDLAGKLTSVEGNIGNITLKGVALFDADSAEGSIGGGNILSPEILMAAVKGKSIGNITLTGGSLGSADSPVLINVPGDVGNIVVKKLHYKSAVTEEEVLDKAGDPVLDADGNVRTRLVTHYADQGGGIWTDLDTSGKLGNLTTCGGNLDGTIHAALGMGNITVESIMPRPSGSIKGIAYFDTGADSPLTDDDFVIADLTATLLAEPGAAGTGIQSITVKGGSIEGNALVDGKVGKITVTGALVGDASGVEQRGGNFSSQQFHATTIGDITLVAGNLTATIEADASIGKISVTGGGIQGDLTARDSIGNITVSAVARDATYRHYYEDGAWWFDSNDGQLLDGQVDFTIHLTGPADTARLGVITGIGVDVAVSGETSFDPTDSTRLTINSKALTYVTGWEWDDDLGRAVKSTETVGGPGPDHVTNGVSKIEGP